MEPGTAGLFFLFFHNFIIVSGLRVLCVAESGCNAGCIEFNTCHGIRDNHFRSDICRHLRRTMRNDVETPKIASHCYTTEGS